MAVIAFLGFVYYIAYSISDSHSSAWWTIGILCVISVIYCKIEENKKQKKGLHNRVDDEEIRSYLNNPNVVRRSSLTSEQIRAAQEEANAEREKEYQIPTKENDVIYVASTLTDLQYFIAYHAGCNPINVLLDNDGRIYVSFYDIGYRWRHNQIYDSFELYAPSTVTDTSIQFNVQVNVNNNYIVQPIVKEFRDTEYEETYTDAQDVEYEEVPLQNNLLPSNKPKK